VYAEFAFARMLAGRNVQLYGATSATWLFHPRDTGVGPTSWSAVAVAVDHCVGSWVVELAPMLTFHPTGVAAFDARALAGFDDPWAVRRHVRVGRLGRRGLIGAADAGALSPTAAVIAAAGKASRA
jgi:hypothetical protein